jgi:hypothetical protein
MTKAVLPDGHRAKPFCPCCMASTVQRCQESQRRTWCWSSPARPSLAWNDSSTVQRLPATCTKVARAREQGRCRSRKTAPIISQRVAGAHPSPAPPPWLCDLEAERQVMTLIARRMSNLEIAPSLYLSEGTVRSQWRHSPGPVRHGSALESSSSATERRIRRRVSKEAMRLARRAADLYRGHAEQSEHSDPRR